MGNRIGGEGILQLESGFCYRALTSLGGDSERGAGRLQGRDGSEAHLQWERSVDGPFIMRLEPPGANHWGIYRVGFPRPVLTRDDLQENLEILMPKLAVLYQRWRVQ
jgi:hypothetical protein